MHPATQSTIDALRVGDVLNGQYRLTQQLGRGPAGVVYEADDSLLSRRVAIRIADDRDQGFEQLVDEARALAAVRHPGLPAVHGIGLHRGWSYLVMERIAGVSLAQHLDRIRRPMTLDEGLAILVPIAETLAAVHAAGLVHGRLEPANIILGHGRTVLLELGWTRNDASARPGAAHLVDTYAFGAIAFELLAGQPPPPAHLILLRPDLPRGLAELVDACLATDPLDRPRDMQAITWELRNLRRRADDGSGPVQAMPYDVLVVDGDASSRFGLAAVLESQGFLPRTATDGREAIEQIRQTGWRPAVIVLDLSKPAADGDPFLTIQAGDPLLRDIPVVLVTASATHEARRFGSVRGVVTRPVAMPTLLVLLREVCRSIRRPAAAGPAASVH